MTAAKLPEEVLRRTVEVYEQCGRNKDATARTLGCARSTLNHRLNRATEAGITVEPKEWSSPELIEVRERLALTDEINRLKAELKAAHRADIESSKVRSEILDLKAECNFDLPSWTMKPPKRSEKSPGVPVTQWSDWHIQEVIRSTEVGGVNEFNSTVARERVRRLVNGVVDLCLSHMVNPNYPGIVVVLGGDMITGEIHPTLAETNDLTTPQGILEAYELIKPALGLLADKFGRVLVACVPGNHARDTVKPRFKRYTHRNFDWLLYCFLERAFQDDARVQFLVPESTDLHFRVYGHRFMVTHGDCLGVRGGDGIIGAIGPIMRGRIKTHTSEVQVGRDFDTLLLHHWHQTIPPAPGLGVAVNNALCGYNEYARLQLRSRFETASQNLFFVHERRGITCHWRVQLQDEPTEAGPWVSWQGERSAS